MIVYWFLFIFIILWNILPEVSEKKMKFSFILIFIYAAIRVDFGLDYLAYEESFFIIKNSPNFISNDVNFEIGYIFLNRILPSFRVLIVVLSAFTCITYYYLFKKYIPAKYYWLAFLLMMLLNNYMLFFQLSGLRNGVAVSIFTLSLGYIRKRKIIPYFMLFIVAFCFHNTSIIIMPIAYFLVTPNKITDSKVVVWIGSVLLLVFLPKNVVLGATQTYINRYFEKYDTYVEIAYESKDEKGILLFSFCFIIMLITLYVSRKNKFPPERSIIIKLLMVFVLSLLLGVLNFRFSQYLAPFLIIGVIYVMDSKIKPIIKSIYFITILLFLVYNFFIIFIGSEYFVYDEYHSIFY